MDELAWSVWEFGKARSGDALLLDRATEFLATYRQAGDPVERTDAWYRSSESTFGVAQQFPACAALGYPTYPVGEQTKFAAFVPLDESPCPNEYLWT